MLSGCDTTTPYALENLTKNILRQFNNAGHRVLVGCLLVLVTCGAGRSACMQHQEEVKRVDQELNPGVLHQWSKCRPLCCSEAQREISSQSPGNISNARWFRCCIFLIFF